MWLLLALIGILLIVFGVLHVIPFLVGILVGAAVCIVALSINRGWF